MANELPLPGALVRSPSMAERMWEGAKIALRFDCCNGVNANDCMNHNKTAFGGIMLIIGLIVGGLLVFFIMYYINDPKPTNK